MPGNEMSHLFSPIVGLLAEGRELLITNEACEVELEGICRVSERNDAGLKAVSVQRYRLRIQSPWEHAGSVLF